MSYTVAGCFAVEVILAVAANPPTDFIASVANVNLNRSVTDGIKYMYSIGSRVQEKSSVTNSLITSSILGKVAKQTCSQIRSMFTTSE
jgi:phosphoglucomutase